MRVAACIRRPRFAERPPRRSSKQRSCVRGAFRPEARSWCSSATMLAYKAAIACRCPSSWRIDGRQRLLHSEQETNEIQSRAKRPSLPQTRRRARDRVSPSRPCGRHGHTAGSDRGGDHGQRPAALGLIEGIADVTAALLKLLSGHLAQAWVCIVARSLPALCSSAV